MIRLRVHGDYRDAGGGHRGLSGLRGADLGVSERCPARGVRGAVYGLERAGGCEGSVEEGDGRSRLDRSGNGGGRLRGGIGAGACGLKPFELIGVPEGGCGLQEEGDRKGARGEVRGGVQGEGCSEGDSGNVSSAEGGGETVRGVGIRSGGVPQPSQDGFGHYSLQLVSGMMGLRTTS